MHEMSNLFFGTYMYLYQKNFSKCCNFTKLSILFSSYFLTHLPNGPIQKVCIIISSVYCKEKNVLCFSVESLGMDNILEPNVILISLD